MSINHINANKPDGAEARLLQESGEEEEALKRLRSIHALVNTC
jgi:hypothetical protein